MGKQKSPLLRSADEGGPKLSDKVQKETQPNIVMACKKPGPNTKLGGNCVRDTSLGPARE